MYGILKSVVNMPRFAHGESKDKLTILFYSEASGLELQREQLYRAMVETECISYFAFQAAMNELEEDGYIAAIPRAFGQGYRVTVRGQEILSLFGESLPHSLREKLTQYADAHRDEMRLETELVSSMAELSGGGYRVELTAQNRDAVELSIALNLASRDMANRARRNWPAEAERIYRTLLDCLLKQGGASEADEE